MKKIILLIFIFLKICQSGYSNPRPEILDFFIHELFIKNDSTWYIDIDINYKDEFNIFDSIVIKTSAGRGVYITPKDTSGRSASYLSDFILFQGVFTIGNDSLKNKIKIKASGDYLVIVEYVTYNGFVHEQQDSISFGNITNAMYPALDSSKVIKNINFCGYYRKSTVTNVIDIGKVDYGGFFTTLAGTLHDANSKPIANQEFSIYGYTDQLVDRCYISETKTDSLGRFKVAIFSTDTNSIISSIYFPQNDPIYSHPYSTQPVQSCKLKTPLDIYLRGTVSVPENDYKFILYPNPTSNVATLRYSIGGSVLAKIVISTAEGKIIEQNSLSSNNESYTIRAGTIYPEGLYIVKVLIDNNTVFSKELIINK